MKGETKMPNKILNRLNIALYKALSNLINDCRHLRKQIKIEKNIDNIETLDILKQFNSICVSRSISTDDKVDKMIELSYYYITKYEKRINPNLPSQVNSL